MWFSAIKLALNAGTHIYKKKQEMANENSLTLARMKPKTNGSSR